MILDFLTLEWGCLWDKNRYIFAGLSLQSHSQLHSEAQVIFQPGKNQDRWFTANNLLTQVNHAIDIFEGLTRGYAQTIFLFDNAPSHQKCADDALLAWMIVKGAQI